VDPKELDAMTGIEDDPARSIEQLEEQAEIENQLEAEGEAPAEPEAEEESSDEGQQAETQAQDKRVPLAELVAERKKRQEYERELQELRQQQQEARLKALEAERQAQQPPPEPAKEDPEPDYLDDPKAWTEWKLRDQQRKIEELQEKLTGTADQQRQAAAEQQFTRVMQTSEAAFAAQQKDYFQALTHARQRAFQELKAEAQAMGVQATDEQLAQHLAGQERQLAYNLVQRGIDPARYVYTVAQQRYGYQPPQAEPAAAAPAAEQRPDFNPSLAKASRDALRGLDGGAPATGLQQDRSSGNVPDEFTAAFTERFGTR